MSRRRPEGPNARAGAQRPIEVPGPQVSPSSPPSPERRRPAGATSEGAGGQGGRRLGLLCGLIASALWGAVWVCVRYLVSVRNLDPIFTAGMRFAIGGTAAAIYLVLRGRGGDLRRACTRLGTLSLLGSIGIFGMGLCVFFSGRYTASINSSLIMNSNAIFIGVLAALMGERVPWLRYVGLAVGVGGCAVIMLGQSAEATVGSNDALGGLLALGGALCWASYTVLGKWVVREVGGLASATVTLIVGAVLLLTLAFLRGGTQVLDGKELAVLAFLGVFPTAIAMLLWYYALDLLDASALGPTQYVAPIISTVLGWALLGEPVGLPFLAGTALVMVALHLSTRK